VPLDKFYSIPAGAAKMPSLRLFTIALSLSAQSAYSFAPQALNVRTQPRTAVALQRPNARVARPLRTGAVFATASIPASAAAPSMMSRARSVVLRVATALMCTLATLLLTATRALAAAATKSAAATVGPAITGDMIKWGGVGLLCAGVFMAGGKSNTASSGFEYVEEEETGFAAGAGSLEARPVDDDDAETPSSSPFDGVSDSAFSSALSARMEALSSGKGDEDAEKPPEPPKDDTGYNGSTGLMERPKPSDVPSVDKGAVDDFPVGFPLRDFEPEDVDVAPAASADDIAMLARMFGTSEPSKDD